MSEFPTLSRVFAVDLRSLALFRIALALAVLNDLALRAADFHEHYTDAGILPIAEVEPTRIGSAPIPFHLFHGSPGYQAMLFVIAALFAVGLLCGYRTRLCTIATWLLQASLCARMPDVLYGADFLLRSLLLWAMFLPLGARFSLDTRHREDLEEPHAYFSAASVAVLLQYVFLFVFAALLKLEVDTWRSGRHLSIALEHDWWVRTPGKLLQPYAWLTQLLTYGTIIVEGIVPFVLLIPRRSARAVGIVLMLGFQAGLAASLYVGMFPLVVLTGLIPFIPSWCWDSLTPNAPPTPAAPRAPAGRRATNVVVVGLIVWCLLANVTSLRDRALREHIPWRVVRVSQIFGVDQFWGMFTSGMTSSDGWLVVRGTLADGSHVNVLEPDKPATFEKPASVAASFSNQRWTHIYAGKMRPDREDFWSRYAEVMTRKWRREHPSGSPLTGIEVTFFHEPIPFDGSVPLEEELLWPPRDTSSAGLGVP